MPLAVMGIGLAWLMTSSRHGHGYSTYEPRSFSTGGGDGLGPKAHGIGEKASDLVSGVKDKLTSAGSTVTEGSRSAAQGLSSAAESAMDKASEYRDRAQRSFGHLLESEPLLVGAVGLIVGAAVGAALPHTDVEDRAVGPLRDKVLEKGKDIAQETMQQAGEVAQAAYQGVKDELANSDGSDASPTERAESLARTAVQAGRDQFDGPAN
jgi:hypothetical protein